MNRNLIITDTRGMSRHDWLLHRKGGLGASDIGTVLGLNPYKSRLELFHERISATPDLSIENMAKFMGKEMEDFIANLWQYWDGSEQSVIMNERNGNIIRRCRRANGYINNPKFPWLFVSLDRIINKGNTDKEGALEIKTIAGYEANKWEAGIPMSHIVQVMTQMLVCEFDFGEIATLEDGRRFFVYPFEYMPGLAKQIINESKSFWQSVEKGRIIKTQLYEAEMQMNQRLIADLSGQLTAIEPEPDGTEAYERYLKEKYKKSMAIEGLIKGTDEDYKMTLELCKVKNKIKKLETEQRLYENTLKKKIAHGQVLDFGKDGSITWKGSPRMFLVKVKGENKEKL